MFHKRAKGRVGEDVACKYLVNKGYLILDRNFLRKWGELDIIAQKNGIIHFFEVKSIVVGHFLNQKDLHRPEDNVDGWKVKHLRRIMETYLETREFGLETEFQFHVVCVYLNLEKRTAKVTMLDNIVI